MLLIYQNCPLLYASSNRRINERSRTIKIVNAYPGMSDPMTEEEIRNFMANKDNKLLIRLGLIDEKGGPNVVPLAYYFDDTTNNIYVTTQKTTKKVSNHAKDY